MDMLSSEQGIMCYGFAIALLIWIGARLVPCIRNVTTVERKKRPGVHRSRSQCNTEKALGTTCEAKVCTEEPGVGASDVDHDIESGRRCMYMMAAMTPIHAPSVDVNKHRQGSTSAGHT